MLGLGLSTSPPLLQGLGATDLQAGRSLVAGAWHGSAADVESELHSLRAAVDTSQRNLLQLENKLGARLEHICRRHVDDVMANSNPLQELKQGLLRVQSECRHLGLGAGRLPSARDIDEALERHRTSLEERVSERIYNLERALAQQQQSALERLEGRGGETWRTCLHRMSQLEERAMLHSDLPRILEQFMNEVRRSGPELLGANAATSQGAIAELRAAWRRVEATVAGCEARLCGLSEESSAEGRVWRASVAAKIETLDRTHLDLSSRLACCEAGQSAVENGAKRNLEAAEAAAAEAVDRAGAAEKSAVEAKGEALRRCDAMIQESSETLEKRIRSRTDSLRREIEKSQLQLQAHEHTLSGSRDQAAVATQERVAMGDTLATLRAEVEKLVAQVSCIPGSAREASEKDLARGLAGLRHEVQVQVSTSVGKLEMGLNQLRAAGAACDGRITANESRTAELAGGVARIEAASRALENMASSMAAAAAARSATTAAHVVPPSSTAPPGHPGKQQVPAAAAAAGESSYRLPGLAAAAQPLYQPPAAAPVAAAEAVQLPPAAAPAAAAAPPYQPAAVAAAQPVYQPPSAMPATAAPPPHQSPAVAAEQVYQPPARTPVAAAESRHQPQAIVAAEPVHRPTAAAPVAAQEPTYQPSAMRQGTAQFGIQDFSEPSSEFLPQQAAETAVERPPLMPQAPPPAFGGGMEASLGEVPPSAVSFDAPTAVASESRLPPAMSPGEVLGESGTLGDAASVSFGTAGPGEVTALGEATAIGEVTAVGEGVGEETALVPSALGDSVFQGQLMTQEQRDDDANSWDFDGELPLEEPPAQRAADSDDGSLLPDLGVSDSSAPRQAGASPPSSVIEQPAAQPAVNAAGHAAAQDTEAELPSPAMPAAVPAPAAAAAAPAQPPHQPSAATPAAVAEPLYQPPAGTPAAGVQPVHQAAAAERQDTAEFGMQDASAQGGLTQEVESDDGAGLPDLGVDDSSATPQAPAHVASPARGQPDLMDELGLGSDWDDSGSIQGSGAGLSAPNTARTGGSGQSAPGSSTAAAAVAASPAPAAAAPPVGIAGMAAPAAVQAAPSGAASQPEPLPAAPAPAAAAKSSPPPAAAPATGMTEAPPAAGAAAPRSRFGIAGSLGVLEEEQAQAQEDFGDDDPLPLDAGLEASMNSWDTGSPAGGSRSFDRSHHSFDAPAASLPAPAKAAAAPAPAASPAKTSSTPTPAAAAAKASTAASKAEAAPAASKRAAAPAQSPKAAGGTDSARSVMADLGFDSDDAPMEDDDGDDRMASSWD